jgi:cellulose biosynthesis protein BcsQ
MKFLTLYNNKGRVGKTTLVYHLAWMFSLQGCSVLAADLDPQCNLTATFLTEEQIENIPINSTIY